MFCLSINMKLMATYASVYIQVYTDTSVYICTWPKLRAISEAEVLKIPVIQADK